MTKPTLLETIATRRLVCDGGMGTQLMLAGLEQGGSGEAWNITHPERVLAIQKRYVAAGANCIITNTFGGSRLMLKRHGVADEVATINAAAVRIAREAFGDQPGYVLGDIGPLGAILEPYGDLPYDDAVAAITDSRTTRRATSAAPDPSCPSSSATSVWAGIARASSTSARNRNIVIAIWCAASVASSTLAAMAVAPVNTASIDPTRKSRCRPAVSSGAISAQSGHR